MDRRSFLSCAAALSVSSLSRISIAVEQPLHLNNLLEAIRSEHGLPGIAAAGIIGDRIAAEGVAGVRKIGADNRLELDDRFGMASCTKKMTAAMVGRVIDSGKLLFDTTLAEALPGIGMRDEYKSVTVAQLLTHKGGLPTYLQASEDAAPNLYHLKGTPREQRTQFIERVLQEAPIAKPGTEANYSNAGYSLLGFVAERSTGKSWESLMTDEIFQPLGMKNAAFGRPWSADRPNQPLLHEKGENGYVPEALDRDNKLEILAPAGNVCCSIRDFAKFAMYELAAARGHNRLLKPETAKRFEELTRRPSGGATVKTGGGKKKKGPGGDKAVADGKGDSVAKSAQRTRTPAFFGGSNFISSGCMLWADENQSVVVAINAGGAHDAIHTAFEQIKQRLTT